MKLFSLFPALVLPLLLAAPLPAQDRPPQPFPGLDIPPPSPTPGRFELRRDPEPLPGTPWTRAFTTDELGRVITLYLNEPAPTAPPDQPAPKLPLIIYVQGSGSQSVFTRVESAAGIRTGASGGHGSVRQAAAGRAIVVIAEKPGVRFLARPSQPGGAEEGSPEFRQEHTLPRWSAAVAAALKAALSLPSVDHARILVEGHSEGGLVACKVAADNPEVTHVATLAGGGPTQLFDLIELARRGVMCGSKPRQPEECVQWLLDQWDTVLKDPDSPDAFFFGHPHRRWTSFLATSPLEELGKTRAKVFIGQGTDDKAVHAPSADVLFATLKARGRDVAFSRVPGDHAFLVFSEGAELKGDGWQDMHARVVEWFLSK